jgi:hypothetical protein
MSDFIVARNPDVESSLPFLVHVPIDGGLWFKAKEGCRVRRACTVTHRRTAE